MDILLRYTMSFDGQKQQRIKSRVYNNWKKQSAGNSQLYL